MRKPEMRGSNLPPAVLVIAGSDSSGGAGLLRDLSTLADFDITALCAITAVTAQSDTQVLDVQHIPPHNIQQQIAGAVATRRIDAIKIGMLGTVATVTKVTESLADLETPLVLDPVLVSSSGGRLLDTAGVAALKKQLLPRTTLLTPNLLEAAALLQTRIAANEAAMIDQAYRLLELGPQAVLIKGGHAAGEHALDFLVTRDQPPLRLSARRIKANMRGTGCALATAIAGLLASGVPLHEACRHAKHYVLKKLSNVSPL